MDYGFLSIIPILVCFGIIVVFRNAFIAIGSGIITALVVIFIGSREVVLIDTLGEVFSSVSTIKTTLFILLVGALISAMEKSGGISGMIAYLEQKNLNIQSKVGVQLFSMLIGILMFVDATSSMAMVAIVGKPLFQKAQIKTEKLALIVNSTASPIAWFIPFGGAGALTAGLLSQHPQIESDAFSYVIKAMPFQFYTVILLLVLITSIIFKFEIGAIRKIPFKNTGINKPKEDGQVGKPIYMLLPIIILFVSIAIILLVTGNGNIMSGDSASAVFYSGLLALIITLIYFKFKKVATIKRCLTWFYQGAKTMFVVTMLLVVALIFSNLLSKAGTAHYLVSLFDVVSSEFLPFITFILAAVIAFSTGTSGGTVTVVTSIIVPMALIQGSSIPLIIGAIISGSVFGDQNSVISDSVILTSSLTGVNAVEHVKTQLPYTVIALVISAVLFLVAGFISYKN